MVYWYWAPKIIHTTFADGLEVYEFGNGQVEKHFVDGSREILFPDKTVKHILTNGEVKTFPCHSHCLIREFDLI